MLTNINGRNFKMLLGEKEKAYTNPVILPSGKWLAFQYSSLSFVSVPVSAVMPFNGTARDILNISFDRSATNFEWSKDDLYLYFTAQINGGIPLYRFNMLAKKVETLAGVDVGITSFGLANNNIIFSKHRYPIHPKFLLEMHN